MKIMKYLINLLYLIITTIKITIIAIIIDLKYSFKNFNL